MKTEIFVMTHKPFSCPRMKGYYPMQVGAALHEDLGYLRDDVGDHISELNPYYAELTGLYWLWRNYHAPDIVGICHYRRYFIDADQRIMTAEAFEEILKDHDMIVSVVENDATGEELQKSSYFCRDYEVLHETLRRLYPEDDPAYRKRLQEICSSCGKAFLMSIAPGFLISSRKRGSRSM